MRVNYFVDSRPNNKIGLLDIIELLPNNTVMVEIGCYQGKSTMTWAGCDKINKLYAVDFWQNGYDDHDKASYQKPMNEIEADFDNNMKPYDGKFIKIKSDSVAAAEGFDDESLDFVYIDAGHSYDYVAADIAAWLPKVKPDGIIGGHDYGDGIGCVGQAVRALTGVPDRLFADSSWIKYMRNL